MIRVEFVPLDAGKETIGPFEWESFYSHLVVGSEFRVFHYAAARGSFGYLSLPEGAYLLQCKVATPETP